MKKAMQTQRVTSGNWRALSIAGKDLLTFNPPEVEDEILRRMTECNELPSPKFGTKDIKAQNEQHMESEDEEQAAEFF